MKTLLSRVIPVLIILLVSSVGHAQYVWQVAHDYKDDSTVGYAPLLLSCSGTHCTAAMGIAGRHAENWLGFIRSDDGGLSWREQWHTIDPGKPSPTFNYFIAIQQIDSLNVVAVGDSGHIFRTFDGGVTWEKQTCVLPGTAPTIGSVHFHDPMNGIAGGIVQQMTTSDGGRHWNLATFMGFAIQNCHCYGPGKFAVISETTGQIFRTSDNWVTIDSTLPISDTSLYISTRPSCNWGDGDTVIVFDADKNGSLIVRTSNGGNTWVRSTLPQSCGLVISMTALDGDTLLAGCSYPGSVLFSSDQGRSWRFDTVPVPKSLTMYASSIARPSPGVVLATMPFPGNLGVIVRGSIVSADVTQLNHTIGIAHAYPNPASESVQINFTVNPAPVVILDVLGREVVRLPSPTSGPLTVSTNTLPAGIYFAMHGMERVVLYCVWGGGVAKH